MCVCYCYIWRMAKIDLGFVDENAEAVANAKIFLFFLTCKFSVHSGQAVCPCLALQKDIKTHWRTNEHKLLSFQTVLTLLESI